MVGSGGFPYSEFLPKEGQARAVQIDIEPEMLSLRYPMEVNLVGDAAETLRALLPLLRERSDHAWRKRIEGWTATCGRYSKSGQCSPPSRSTRSALLGNCHHAFPSGRSSLVIPVPAQTGTRAI
jgi:thiamine pyrophosphate-dependent acetolactate synthase large subunit-like protein